MPLRYALHVCGKWASQLVRGEMPVGAFGETARYADRIQLNTDTRVTDAGLTAMRESGRRFIAQVRGDQDSLVQLAVMAGAGVDVVCLFDRSGGRGQTPLAWPRPLGIAEPGYAGGLGPDNVGGEVMRIAKVCPVPYWVDMETGVRTGDVLDLDKVERVLRAVDNIRLGKTEPPPPGITAAPRSPGGGEGGVVDSCGVMFRDRTFCARPRDGHAHPVSDLACWSDEEPTSLGCGRSILLGVRCGWAPRAHVGPVTRDDVALCDACRAAVHGRRCYVTAMAVDAQGNMWNRPVAHDPRCCASCHHVAHQEKCPYDCACELRTPAPHGQPEVP